MTGLRRNAHASALVALLFLAALAGSSCTSGDSGGTGATGAASGAKAVPDTAKALETPIVAADGGTIGLVTNDGSLVRVTFPSDTLAKDMTIVATPLSTAPGQDADTMDKGFLLEEKGTGAGPALSTPVWVEMVVPRELGDDVAMVTYKDDGTYEVLPTKIRSGGGKSAVLALATHFSPVTTKRVGKDKANKARDKFSDFNWVVYVSNTQKGEVPPLKMSVKLKLRAVNAGGDIAGDYTGDATITTTNEGTILGGKASSPQVGKSDSVNITLTEIDPLASLTEEDPLASLTDDGARPDKALDKMPQWWGKGTIKMSAMAVAGSASGYIGGYGGSTGVGNTSELPVVMNVMGTQVTVTVSGLSPGSMTFPGYIIGEGK